MSSDMSVVFLGTSSGGGPSDSRNCSSLVCDMLADHSLWMVDCAEGTTRQFALQPARLKPNLKIQNVKKVFVTHMHADHVMGLIAFLRNVLLPPPLQSDQRITTTNSGPTIDIYGPSGLRTFIRQNLKLTLTRTNWTYAVHELLNPHDPLTPCIDAPRDHPARMDASQVGVMHYSEEKGKDLRAGEDGLWRGITSGHGRRRREGSECVIWVDAGPILHRDPCIGYVFTESLPPARKLVILGDTFDPSAILPLCTDASLLIHEATDSHISFEADPSGKLAKRTKEQVKERALGKGHSVPEMAGEFAKRIGASALVLNHIGGRFPAPRSPTDNARFKIIRDIEKHAESTWGIGKSCKVAHDFLRIDVPMPAPIHGTDNSNLNPPRTQLLPVEAIPTPDWNLMPQTQDVSGSAIPAPDWNLEPQTTQDPSGSAIPAPEWKLEPQTTQDGSGSTIPAPDRNLEPQTTQDPSGSAIPGADWNLVTQTQNAILGNGNGNGRKRARSVERDSGLPANRDGDRDRDRSVDSGGRGSRSSRRRRRGGRGRGTGEHENASSSHTDVGRGNGNRARGRGQAGGMNRGEAPGFDQRGGHYYDWF